MHASGFRPLRPPDRLIAPKAPIALSSPRRPALFAAASARESRSVPELREPAVTLRPMTAGGEVVEDYGHVGLTLRNHPVSFLREELAARRIVTCAEAMAARDWPGAVRPDRDRQLECRRRGLHGFGD